MHRRMLSYFFALAVATGAYLAHADTYTATNIVVAPLTGAHWVQGAPYNMYTPHSSWQCGCEAISSSQEFLVWKWPWRLGAIHTASHYVNGEDDSVLRFDGSVPFDWDSMKLSYSDGGTLKQKHEAARLSLMCQSLLQMQYVSGGGDAKKQIPGTMEWYEYVGSVKPNENGGDDEAVAAIRADFEFGSPTQVGVPQHAVVGLGYATGTNSVGTAVDLIWLNYGWGGGSDGWYDLRSTEHYADSGLLYTASPLQNVHVGFRPIKSVQIEPIAPISASDVTIKWHLPNCYTNKIDGFSVAKKKISESLTNWTDDFAVSDGRSSNTNVMRIRNGQLYAWSGQGTTGIYTWDNVFVPTKDTELTYDAVSCYMSSMEARFEVKVDGVWDTIAKLPLSGKIDDLVENGATVSLSDFADNPIQLRFVVEYTKGGVFQHDVANIHIDNVSVSNVKTFETVSTDDTIAASARSATFSGLTTGDTYAFSVTPIMSDGSAAVTQTVATTIGDPAESPVIGAVTMSPRGTDLVQEGFYADIAMGWNVIDVACENVATLEAFPSHQSVLPQNKIEVVDNGGGSFSINIDATEVASKWANQNLILTLKATNATGETAYKDLELCLKASGVPEKVPGGKVWTGGSALFGASDYTAKWAGNVLPSDGDKVTFKTTDEEFGAEMNLNLSTPTTLGYVLATGDGQLTISGTSSEMLTANVLKNDIQVEINSSKFKVNKAIPSANIVIDSGSCLDCEIDQSLSSYIKKVSGGHVSALADSSLWKGTVVFSGYTAAGLNFNSYGNNSSFVRLNGVSGYLGSQASTTFNPAVELEDDGDTPAFHWNNGWGGYTQTIKALVGDGTFKTSGSGAGEWVVINDIDNFTGSFSLASKTVAIGTSVGTTANNGRLNVNSGKSATIAGGKTWTIGGGVYLAGNQTLTVNGTLSDSGALAAEGTGTVLEIAPTGSVSAASLSFANNTIRLSMTQDASPTLAVTGAADLAGATIEIDRASGMPVENSITLMTAGSFEGADTATLSGLDGYSLEVTDGTLYAVKDDPIYDGPEPIAVWVGNFSSSVDGCSLNTNGNSFASGVITIADGYQGLDVNLESGTNAITVIVKYTNLVYSTSNDRVLFASCANSAKSTDRTIVRLATDNTLKGTYGNNSGAASTSYNATLTSAIGSSGYMVFCYGDPSTGDNRGTLLCSGATEGAINTTNYWASGLKFDNDSTGNSIYGATIGGYRKEVSGWKNATGMAIEAIAVFTARLTAEERNAYRFPEPSEPEEPTVVARLVVNSATAGTYATLDEALNALAMQLFLNPTADVYVEIVDDELETPNEYGASNIGYSATERKYARAVTKLGNGTDTSAFLNLADAWAAAGKGADTATITILSDPSDSVTVDAGQTLKVIAGSADLSDNVSFAAGLMTYTTTSGSVTTYTARNKGTTLPGIDTNVPMTVGDFALDSTGEWAEIVNAPIRMTLDPSVNRFKLSFDVDIPTGVYGTLFSWDSTNSDESVDSRVVVTNDASKMVIYRKNDGTLSTVGYSESTLITSGQHTITVQWVHNAGCTIYLDGNKSYSSSNLAFTNHDTATLAIGGSALGSPDDVLAGLKVRNFTYIVYSDVVTRLDGTIYHGNDANRAVITNYLSQMVGSRPVKMPAPNTVDLLLVYDPNAVAYATNHYATVEEHAAHNVAVMNQALTTTDIDTNAWFRIAGIYQVDVAAANVDDALAKLNSGTAEGWDQVNAMRDQVGADVVLGVVYTNSNYGLANWCSPAEIMNGGGANYAFAGVRADAAWSWVHEVGHVASLYHSPGEAAGSYGNPTTIGCGFSKTAEADMAELRSIMASGTAQLAFSSPNHMSHGEIYSVTNSVGKYVDSSGELARLLPYMAKYRRWVISPQSGSEVADGDLMTVSFDDPDATIWVNRYGEESETQYDGPILIDTSSPTCIYVVTAKKDGEPDVTTTVFYTVDQPLADPVAKIGDTPYDSLADAVEAATASSAESVEISLLKASSEAVTLDAKTTITEASSGLYTGTLSGSGTLVLAGTRSSALSFNNWTGTVVLPELASIAGSTFNFNYYGVEGSTVRINGIGGGWLKNDVINPKIDIPAGKTLTISDFSASFANTFKALSGAGTLSFTYNTAIDTTASNWYSGYSAYYLIQDVSGFTGTLSTATPGIAIGTAKPHYQTAGGKILLTSADARLAATASPEPETMLEGYFVKYVDGVYSLERCTATDYPVPYSWFSDYGITDAFSSPEEKAANGQNTYWESYVLGLDPTNETSKFETTIKMVNGSPVVEYSPTNTTLTLQYILQGKPLLNNDWQDVEFDDPGATNRFFRVKIKWE